MHTWGESDVNGFIPIQRTHGGESDVNGIIPTQPIHGVSMMSMASFQSNAPAGRNENGNGME